MSTVYDWMKQGYTLVPNVFFNRFSQLNLNSDEFVLVLYILSQVNQGQGVRDLEYIQHQLGWTSEKLYGTLDALLNKQILSIELVTNQDGKQEDHYTLRPLFEKLDQEHFQKEDQKIDNSTEAQALVTDFEREFGRVLTPLELDTLNTWINKDGYEKPLIRLALREAVLRQAISFKYIDKILLNWEKANIKTAEDAETYLIHYEKQNKQTKSVQQPLQDPYADIQIPIIEKYKRK